ncbi:MAG: hypothetical protein V4677_05565 [Bacteroidota bacterium]
MNTIKSLILVLVLITGTLNATTNTEDVLKSASLKIKESLKMPSELSQENRSQKITIYFSVNEDGDVIKVNAKTKNAEAKKDLEEQFRHLNFKGLNPAVYNSIDINFKVC